ncbi:hypothetical protein H4W33_006573 [Kibdelosporangium phytohabitans]|nr:hypothetical protein [Kibdelosporangium phytohabitans]
MTAKNTNPKKAKGEREEITKQDTESTTELATRADVCC